MDVPVYLRPSVPSLWRNCPLFFAGFLPDFPCRFAIMAGHTQALMVVGIGEQRHVTSMGHNVVNHCGKGTHPVGCTRPTKWFTKQLSRAQFLFP